MQCVCPVTLTTCKMRMPEGLCKGPWCITSNRYCPTKGGRETARILTFLCLCLFSWCRCPAAHHIMEEEPSIKQQWNYALQWLQTELERVWREGGREGRESQNRSVIENDKEGVISISASFSRCSDTTQVQHILTLDGLHLPKAMKCPTGQYGVCVYGGFLLDQSVTGYDTEHVLPFHSYFLERSNSARLTLTRARELFPVEVNMSVLFFFCVQHLSGGKRTKRRQIRFSH